VKKNNIAIKRKKKRKKRKKRKDEKKEKIKSDVQVTA